MNQEEETQTQEAHLNDLMNFYSHNVPNYAHRMANSLCQIPSPKLLFLLIQEIIQLQSTAAIFSLVKILMKPSKPTPGGFNCPVPVQGQYHHVGGCQGSP